MLQVKAGFLCSQQDVMERRSSAHGQPGQGKGTLQKGIQNSAELSWGGWLLLPRSTHSPHPASFPSCELGLAVLPCSAQLWECFAYQR